MAYSTSESPSRDGGRRCGPSTPRASLTTTQDCRCGYRWVSSRAGARAPSFVKALRLQPENASAGERVYADTGADHVGAARVAYADERIYQWLLARRPVDA
jgi:hypothetical protein